MIRIQELQITNTPAALAHTVSAMRDYLPIGFTYKAGTAFVTDAISYPTGMAVVGTQIGNQVNFIMPLPNPSTGATYPGTVTLNFDAYAATATTGTFTDNAGMLVSVNALPAVDVYSGDTAPVTLTKFRIGDTVFFDNDASGTLNVGDTYAAAVTLELRPMGGGVGSAIASTSTNASGHYGFLINSAGVYDVVVTDTSGILLSHASSTGGKTQTATLNALTPSVQTLDFGYIPPALSAVIEGTVFDDYNNNAVQNIGEAGIAAVTLGLYNLFGTLINTYSTPVGGTFRFAGIAGGLYQINVLSPPTGYGGTSIALPLSVNVADGAIAAGNDIGYLPFGSLSGNIFSDTSGDGIKQIGETGGFAGVVVERYNAAMVLLDTYTSDTNGDYIFPLIAATDYYVQVQSGSSPIGHGATTAQPIAVTVVDAVINSGNNIGYQPNGNVAGTVFLDTNANGIKNAGETTTFGSVVIDRYTIGMGFIDSYTADANGQFQFNLLPAGDYYVQVHTDPVGYGATTTQPFKVTAVNATTSTGNDLGYQTFGSVAGTVFEDVDGSASYNTGDNTYAGVSVDRYTTGGTFIDSYTTDANGAYQFSQITAGNYLLYAYPPALYGATTVIPLAVTASNGIVNTGNDIGFRIYGSLSGTVFSDGNGNAIMDGGEGALTGIVVDRYSNGGYVNSYTSDGSGGFQFIQIAAGNYDLYAHLPTGFGATTGQPLVATATLGISNTGNNIGFQQASTISGKVFADVNNTGVFDAGDAWLAGATVYLKKAGITVDTYVTAGGGYDFTGLLVGTNPSVVYTVDVDQTLTPINNATLTTANDPASVTITLASANTVADIGYLIQGSIAGTIYEDKNATLVFDTVPLPTDTVLTGTVVNLYNNAMALLASTTSAVDGSFSFTGLVGADYYVEAITPATYSAVAPIVIAPATQPIHAITLASGTVLTAQNFGFTLPPNLVVTKTTPSPFASINVPITYAITVTNTGGTAKNVVVTDWVPNLAFAGWLGVPAPTLSPEGVTTPALTPTQLWFNGVLVTATLPLAPYTQITVAGATTAWSMTPTGFILNNGDVLKFVFTVDSLMNGTQGTFFNSLQVNYLNGAIPVTQWYPDLNTITVTKTYFPDKKVVAVNGIPWGGGTPTVDVGDTITYAVTITNLRGKGKINKDEVAVALLTENLPLGFKYVVGSTKVISPGNGVLVLTPLAVDGVVLPAASPIVKEVITYTFNGGAIPAGLPIMGDSMITGANLNDTATLQFDAYAYDALTPNAPLAGTHTNRATTSANRLGKGIGILETIVSAPVTVSANAHVSGTMFHELTIDGVYNAATLDTAFNGITVELQPAGGGVAIDSYTTSIDGVFDLIAPGAGSYQVVITDTAGILTGFSNTIMPLIIPITLTNGQRLLGQDYGYVLSAAPATISGTIFADANADGILNGADAGIANATVNLTSLVGTVLATAITNPAGLYTFNNLAAGSYKIDVLNTSLPLVGLYNTPAASPIDPYSLTVAAGSISSQGFGWAQGATFSGIVFDAYSLTNTVFVNQPGHANITMNLVDTTRGTVIRTATTAYSPIAPAIIPKLGSYNFDAVAPGTYRIDVTDTFGGLLGYALTTANQPMTPLAVTGGLTYTNNFGYFKAPNIAVIKTMTSSTLNQGEKMDITLTATNTGGGVAAFSIADVMPSLAPVSPFIGGLGTYLASVVPYVFDTVFTVKLDGVTLAAGVDYTAPIIASATPTWTLTNGLPGGSVLEIHFTGVQPLASVGSRGSPNYNGVAIQYGTPATVVDYPNVITFSVVKDLTFSKRISAINGIAYTGTGRPTIYPGDRITFQLAVANTIRGRQIDVTSFGDTLPADAVGYGLSYAPYSSILTNPFGGLPPAVILDPVITQYATPGIAPYTTVIGASQGLAWAAFIVPLPATLMAFPSEVVLQFDVYASTSFLPGLYINQGQALAARTGKVAVAVNASRDFSLTYNLAISKTVNRASTPPGTFVTYTVTIVNNAATGSVTGLTLTDQLANGFSYMSGTSKFNGIATTDPTGITTQPVWVLPAIAAGTTLTVSFSADVASWIPLGTYNNTATIKDMRGVSVISTGATAPVSIAAQALLTVIKQSNVARAPPGGVIAYTVTTQNTGVGIATNVTATDHLSEYVMLATDPWANGTPVKFTDGANSSGLTLGSITYSNDAGATFAYTLNMGSAYDPYVTDFKVQTSGVMNANPTANPKFDLQYKVQVK